MNERNEDFFKRELVTTGDGSSSIFLPGLNEHYHSHHGAVQESKHVFMKMGWEEAIKGKSSVEVLEIGFGTGLNAYLVLDKMVGDEPSCPQNVYYTTVEAFPVEPALVAQLDYWKAGSFTDEELNKDGFRELHEAPWTVPTEIYPGFTLEKLQIHLQDFIPYRQYDLIFFDAFSPRSQPELWTKEVFQKMYGAMKEGGILVTYCAKGEVRRNMIAAGFTVERLPGPPGKREMLRARR